MTALLADGASMRDALQLQPAGPRPENPDRQHHHQHGERDQAEHPGRASKICEEEPDLFDTNLQNEIYEMAAEAIECETLFANDVLSQGVSGLSVKDMRQYLEFVADRRFERLGMKTKYNVKNPFSFLDLQDVQELTNFFERRVSSYQVGVEGNVEFNETF